MKTPELKPCPFCGGKPYLANVGMVGCAYVVCTDCRVQGDEASREGAIAAWNRRADLAAVPAQVMVKPLVALVEELTTAVWHLMDNSETSGPIDDPTITVWQPDFDTVCGLLDRIEGLPSGSTDDMTAGELLSANILAALEPHPDHRDEVIARLVEAGSWLSVCAQTTGGTAGRDDDLVNAISSWTAALAAAKAVLK